MLVLDHDAGVVCKYELQGHDYPAQVLLVSHVIVPVHHRTCGESTVESLQHILIVRSGDSRYCGRMEA